MRRRAGSIRGIVAPRSTGAGSYRPDRVGGSAGARTGYVSAYAEPVGGGERVWYFSAEHSAPAIAASGGATAPLDAAVQIGPEHRPGRYFVHLVVAARPLSRSETLQPPAGDALASETFPLVVAP